MKRKLSKPAFLAVFCYFLLTSVVSKANINETVAGEVYYQWISDSTYQVCFRSYHVCEGLNQVPASMQMGLSSGCSGGVTLVTLPLTATGVSSISCPANKNRCDNPGSIYPGFRQYVYSAIITLPYRCSNWKFSVVNNIGGRYLLVNNLNGDNFCAEATLNNTGTYQGNSSPYFNQFGIFQIINNRPFSFNNMAVDPDGDSLVTEVINPKAKTNYSSAPTDVSFKTYNPALSIPGNPLETNNTFAVNGATGQVSFTPNCTGYNNVTFLIKEYRNGVLIGSVMREVEFILFTNNIAPVQNFTIAVTTGAINTTSDISVCSKQLFTLGVNLKSNDNNSKLAITDDHIKSLPGSTITYSNIGKDSVRAVISWNPSGNVVGPSVLTFSILDTNCNAMTVPINSGITVPINVWGQTSSGKDTGICLGEHVNLKASGGANYSWSVISGTASSLSCTNCSNPVATPLTTTQYLLTSGANAFCADNTDTIVVNVNTNLTYPTAGITVNPDSVVGPQTVVTFTANTSQCSSPTYQWKKNGSNIAGATSVSYSAMVSDNDVITCEVTCADLCASPAKQTSPAITMHIITGISNTNSTSAINLYPNPNTGSFIIEGRSIDNQPVELQVLNALGQKIYQQTITPEHQQVHERLNLDLNNGLYLLKLNNEIYRFVISK